MSRYALLAVRCQAINASPREVRQQIAQCAAILGRRAPTTQNASPAPLMGSHKSSEEQIETLVPAETSVAQTKPSKRPRGASAARVSSIRIRPTETQRRDVAVLWFLSAAPSPTFLRRISRLVSLRR